MLQDIKADLELHDDGAPGSTLAVFLSLFLAMLAFLIALHVLSSFADTPRPAHAVEEVREPVAAPVGAEDEAGPPSLAARRGTNVTALRLLQQRLAAVFTPDAVAIKSLPVAFGDRLQARIRVGDLFVPGETRVRPDRRAMVRRLASIMASPPLGLWCEMEFRLGADGGGMRGGALAMALVQAGVPVDRLAIGPNPGDPGWVVLSFRFIEPPAWGKEAARS